MRHPRITELGWYNKGFEEGLLTQMKSHLKDLETINEILSKKNIYCPYFITKEPSLKQEIQELEKQ